MSGVYPLNQEFFNRLADKFEHGAFGWGLVFPLPGFFDRAGKVSSFESRDNSSFLRQRTNELELVIVDMFTVAGQPGHNDRSFSESDRLQ